LTETHGFDVQPGFRWVGIPVRAPHWLALRPHAPSSTQWRAVLERTPHLEASPGAAPEPPSMISLRPARAASMALVEPTRRPPAHPATLLRAPGDLRVQVVDVGARAHQVSASCSVAPGNTAELTLAVDGVLRTRGRPRGGALRLRASVPAGVHRVAIFGEPALCVLDASAAHGAQSALRTAFALGAERPLRLVVQTRGKTRAVHVALYRSDASPGRLEIAVDGGHPEHRRGAIERMTNATQQRTVDDSAGEAVRLADGAGLSRSFATIVLGDDLAPGRHMVEVSYAGGAQAWARFWTAGRQAQREQVNLWISEEVAD